MGWQGDFDPVSLLAHKGADVVDAVKVVRAYVGIAPQPDGHMSFVERVGRE